MHMGLFRTYALGTFHNLCPWRTFRASSYTHFTTHTLVYYTHFSLRHTLDYTNNSLLHKIWFTTHTWVYDTHFTTQKLVYHTHFGLLDTLYYTVLTYCALFAQALWQVWQVPLRVWYRVALYLFTTHLVYYTHLTTVTGAAPSLISRCSVFDGLGFRV